MVARLVVAAPSSGSGKTTVATGLMAAFAARGLRVSPHKVGPDYIDPGYHALAAGRPGRNLDAWLCGEDALAPLLLHGAAGADVAVIEGVMGLYDGASSVMPGGSGGDSGGDFASTAHVARLLSAPVVLVVDASAAAGRSVAALVHGFATFGRVRIGGVILNRVGSDAHEAMCREAVAGLGLPVLGALRRRDDVAAPSRHLGLVPAAERGADAVAAVRRLGDLVAATCDLDALLALARTAPPLTAQPWTPQTALTMSAPDTARPTAAPYGDGPGPAARGAGARGRGWEPVVAVAGGPAFTFGYAENEELLAAAGARVVRFDPLRDEELPAGTAALVIGGGFPEVHAAGLSANAPLRASVAALAASGAPVYAECAGLLYLARELDGAPMCGVLPDVSASMAPRLTLGYRAAVAVADSAVARTGERVRGHEFHRTRATPGHGPAAAWQWSPTGPEGFVRGACVASYLHLHWAATPWFARRLVEECA
ncbi:cobyrinate a,c-diamide synthase [Actinomadura atramentaria]|uniref:cobyrinate a,c-diamide synthase n=1 Tax=Actinomadura atramentaria TaxID=1990 RepID=UPI00036C4BD2|nr:cobyrinate a,c-diamide synthase [Actinomadura atramentaria]